jgi:hypothetical protein
MDMKNSCEGVTDESSLLAFIDSLERVSRICHPEMAYEEDTPYMETYLGCTATGWPII